MKKILGLDLGTIKSHTKEFVIKKIPRKYAGLRILRLIALL